MPHTVTIVGGIPYQSTPGHHNQPVGIDGLRKGNETRLSAASAVHGIGAAQYELGAHNLMRVLKRLAFDKLHGLLCGRATHRIRILAHGGQVHSVGVRRIVEADIE